MKAAGVQWLLRTPFPLLWLSPQHTDLREKPQSSRSLGIQGVSLHSSNPPTPKYIPLPHPQRVTKIATERAEQTASLSLSPHCPFAPLEGGPLSSTWTRGGHSCATKRGHQNQRLPGVGCKWSWSKPGGHPPRMGKIKTKVSLHLDLGKGVHTATYVFILTRCHLPWLDTPRVD